MNRNGKNSAVALLGIDMMATSNGFSVQPCCSTTLHKAFPETDFIEIQQFFLISERGAGVSPLRGASPPLPLFTTDV
jgi:hypothetical protein